MLSSGLEADVRSTSTPPGASAGIEDGRLGSDKHFLLDGGELDHSPVVVRVAERGEELASNTKIGMVHVGVLGSFKEAQGEAAEV